ncbi:hypothetical protein HOY80DRAFT_892890 [Tuber brumale]|nr:hypothetical protein HOY80DRAFT_892890 [Tuber brumale]
MSKSPVANLSSKYKEFMFDGTVTLFVGRDRKKMEMHKKLLASISPELDKHVNNNMKEGIEGVIHFPEEGEGMLTLFTEWAYTGDYTIVDNSLRPMVPVPPAGTQTQVKANPWPRLRMHLELYVFSDKFNIPTLKLLAKSKFSQAINPVDVTDKADATGLISMIEYVYDNLPDSDPVPKFLARFASWKWGFLRGRDEFVQLISVQPEFMKELLVNLVGLGSRPVLA